MWLAHEAIYLALYAGDLVRPQATDCLRTRLAEPTEWAAEDVGWVW